MMPSIGAGIDPITKVDINTLMNKYGVNQMPNTALKEVFANHFHVETKEGPKDLYFDYGFICLGMKAQTPVLAGLHEAFDKEGVEIINIGDSMRARRIIEGTSEGRDQVILALTKKGFLK